MKNCKQLSAKFTASVSLSLCIILLALAHLKSAFITYMNVL